MCTVYSPSYTNELITNLWLIFIFIDVISILTSRFIAVNNQAGQIGMI